jgi:hypothetical protein
MDPQLSVSWPNVARDVRSLLFVVPVCVALIPISIVTVCQWRAVREAEIQATLKRDLIEHGLSPADVERLTLPPLPFPQATPARPVGATAPAEKPMPREP